MSKEATQTKWDNLCSNSLTAWAYSTYTQVPEINIQIYHVWLLSMILWCSIIYRSSTLKFYLKIVKKERILLPFLFF